MSSANPYFDSRVQAGKELAEKLKDLRYDNVAIIAVSEGSVVVAAQIAAELHCVATLLMVKDIILPDGKTSIGVVNDQGGFVHNNSISVGQLEELELEYRGSIEESKSRALRSMYATLGSRQLIDNEFFRGHTVIVVSDGVVNGNLIGSAFKYLHDIKTEALVLACPIVDSHAVDMIHATVDRQEILRVVPDFIGINHYYENSWIPDLPDLLSYLEDIVIHWKDYEKGMKHD